MSLSSFMKTFHFLIRVKIYKKGKTGKHWCVTVLNHNTSKLHLCTKQGHYKSMTMFRLKSLKRTMWTWLWNHSGRKHQIFLFYCFNTDITSNLCAAGSLHYSTTTHNVHLCCTKCLWCPDIQNKSTPKNWTEDNPGCSDVCSIDSNATNCISAWLLFNKLLCQVSLGIYGC